MVTTVIGGALSNGFSTTADGRRVGLKTLVSIAAGLLVPSSCGGSDGPEVAPTTTVHPDDQAIADSYHALCNDENYSDNDDFAKTCSGGDGINGWLSDSAVGHLSFRRSACDVVSFASKIRPSDTVTEVALLNRVKRGRNRSATAFGNCSVQNVTTTRISSPE
jgi:hypothetical protein